MQSKTGRRVSVLLPEETRAEIEQLRAGLKFQEIAASHVLTTSFGKPWTSDGFKSFWGRAIKAEGLKGLTFHDLRGTAITRAAEAGATVAEIASRYGYSLRDVETMLDRHYLAPSQALGDAVVAKLRTKLQTKP